MWLTHMWVMYVITSDDSYVYIHMWSMYVITYGKSHTDNHIQYIHIRTISYYCLDVQRTKEKQQLYLNLI